VDVEREQQRARTANDERTQVREARGQLTAQRDEVLRQTENATSQAARLREESSDVVGATTDAPDRSRPPLPAMRVSNGPLLLVVRTATPSRRWCGSSRTT
jgi:hypothetical protein